MRSVIVNAGCQFIQRHEIPKLMLEIFAEPWTVVREHSGSNAVMASFRFSVIVPTPMMTHDQTLDATDALGNAGCTDASIRGHGDGIELLFERTADSLQSAISSAIADVEHAGFRVSRVELERDAIPG